MSNKENTRVGFTSSKDYWVSSGVIYFTDRPDSIKPQASHSFPILGMFQNMELAFSADEIELNIITMEKYRTHKDRILRVWELPYREGFDGWQEKLIREMNKKKYPHIELAWFIYRWARRKFNKDWTGKNPIDYGNICSELTVKALVMAGYHEFKVLDANSTDPIELEIFLSKIEGAKLVEVRD